MVVLNKIYTRTGDAGTTALGNGDRVAKHDPRVEAYGTVDELNSFVGVARIEARKETDTALSRIQNDLFDLGADLCRPDLAADAQNVRGGPGTDYGVVTKLTSGDAVEVLMDNGDGWVKMRPVDGGVEGWMADFLLAAG